MGEHSMNHQYVVVRVCHRDYYPHGPRQAMQSYFESGGGGLAENTFSLQLFIIFKKMGGE